MFQLLLYASIAGVLSLLGGLFVVWRSHTLTKIMTPLIAFGAGAFMGVSFLDLLPEAVELVEEPEAVFMAVLVGFFLFFALERFLMKYFRGHAGHEEHHAHTESLPMLVVLGDTLHNFLDGVIIALAFVVSPPAGLATAIAVAAHEVPQEIADFTILLDQGWSKAKIIVVNFISALFIAVGALAGYYSAVMFETRLPYLLAGVAGVFIYIAASDLIPEVHHRAGHQHFYRILFSFLVGLVLVGYLISITHAH